jgi:hypothetical protein
MTASARITIWDRNSAAVDDVDLDGHDHQRDHAHVEQPDAERPLSHHPARQAASLNLHDGTLLTASRYAMMGLAGSRPQRRRAPRAPGVPAGRGK